MNSPGPTADPWMSEAYQPGLVSVIVPTYNRAHLIVRAMDSVFAQTYRPIELIVVDDGSADDTAGVVESWASQHRGTDFQIRLIRQANQGAQVARNRGLRECAGEYIQFLDSDDRILERKLSVQVGSLRKTGADYCYARTERIDETGRVQWILGVGRSDDIPWIVDYVWHTSSPLLMRSVCEAIGPWDESLSCWQDCEYFARIKAGNFDGRFVDEILDQGMSHGGPSITKDSAKYAESKERAMQRVIALLPRPMGTYAIEQHSVAKHFVSIALQYARDGDYPSARRCLESAANVEPGISRRLIKMTSAIAHVVSPLLLLETIHRVVRIRQYAQQLLRMGYGSSAYR